MIYNDSNYTLLLQGRRPETDDGRPQVLPRRTLFGSDEAADFGLRPVHDGLDVIYRPGDIKEVIERGHREKRFPMYHQERHGMLDGWNQNGDPYCWAYSACATVIDKREAEKRPRQFLSPYSLIWMVNYRKNGYYLDGCIEGMAERGIATFEFCPERSNNHRDFREGWENEAKKIKPTEWFDTNPSQGDLSMICQCLTILDASDPLYIAYNWWGHALELIGMHWDESQLNNVVWDIRNSHAEKDPIQLAGRKGVPDEAYGSASTYEEE